MLRYDVTYYLGDRRLPEIDKNVTEAYLRDLHRSLRSDEVAYARCINGGREHDREITAMGDAGLFCPQCGSGPGEPHSVHCDPDRRS